MSDDQAAIAAAEQLATVPAEALTVPVNITTISGATRELDQCVLCEASGKPLQTEDHDPSCPWRSAFTWRWRRDHEYRGGSATNAFKLSQNRERLRRVARSIRRSEALVQSRLARLGRGRP